MRMMPALETCEGECLGSIMLVVASQSTRRVTLFPFTLMPSRCHLQEVETEREKKRLCGSRERKMELVNDKRHTIDTFFIKVLHK